MASFPSKEQLEKLSIDVKLHQEQIVKSDCDYMWSLMAETFSQALKSTTSPYEHTDIDKNKINDWSNMKMVDCKFGPTNQPIENVLASSGIELYICKYSNNKPFMTYDKLRKTLTIYPK